PNPAGDQWLMTQTTGTAINGGETGPIAASWKRSTPLPSTTHPIIAEPVANIEASILPNVGASRRLACDGAWVDNRDAVDTRLVSEHRTGAGARIMVANENDVGGYPPIASGPSCFSTTNDTDGDNLPDAWEMAAFGNPDQTAHTVAANGYTNLENYLDGPPPRP
ncbi:MAG: hypothetical protein ACREH8_04245, partial [Opitutaceae bacterium]